MNCDNCTNTALYYVNDPGANPSSYCDTCLPPWLKVRAAEGHFPLPAAPKKTKKTAEPAAEDESN